MASERQARTPSSGNELTDFAAHQPIMVIPAGGASHPMNPDTVSTIVATTQSWMIVVEAGSKNRHADRAINTMNPSDLDTRTTFVSMPTQPREMVVETGWTSHFDATTIETFHLTETDTASTVATISQLSTTGFDISAKRRRAGTERGTGTNSRRGVGYRTGPPIIQATPVASSIHHNHIREPHCLNLLL